MEFNNWNGKRYDEVIDDFANLLESVKEVYSRDKDVESEMIKKQNDLLHDLELKDLNYHEIARLGKEIRELRRNRREYKNEYIFFESIYRFLKDVGSDKFISSLRELADRIRKDAEIISNLRYTQRSNIKNISEIKKNSFKNDDMKSEDLISLNKLIERYCLNLESNFLDDTNKSIIVAKLQLENPMNLKSLKSFALKLSKNIEDKYKPNISKNIACKLVTSDMLLRDDFNKNILKCNIDICDKDTNDSLYKLNLSIREGKIRDEMEKKINNKSHKKKNGKKKKHH